jgi:hypothetical protein
MKPYYGVTETIVFAVCENFLDVSGVPRTLKEKASTVDYLYERKCYADFFQDIVISLPLSLRRTVAVLGTAGIGKSVWFLFCLREFLMDPQALQSETRSFYWQTQREFVWFYQHVTNDEYNVIQVPTTQQLDTSIVLFADMDTDEPPKRHGAGTCIIFTCCRASRYKEVTKEGWRKVLPTWSEEELVDYFRSDIFACQRGRDIASYACENIKYFGGSIRNCLVSAVRHRDGTIELNGRSCKGAVSVIESAINEKGKEICEGYFAAGLGGCEDAVSDVLVHKNPKKLPDGKFTFAAEFCEYSFASRHIFRRLLTLNTNMCVNKMRNKFCTGTYHGSEDSNDFEFCCLHGFKVSGAEFFVQPLTDAAPFRLTFPGKQILARDWLTKTDYHLEQEVLYVPVHRNLESGDAFCLRIINGIWTLIILQCTIGGNHGVKQNGIKVILEEYNVKSGLVVDETVIIFMIPNGGRLSAQQALTTQDGSVLKVAPCVKISAQFRIENDLSMDVDPLYHDM